MLNNKYKIGDINEIVVVDYISIFKPLSNVTQNTANLVSKMSKLLSELRTNNKRKCKIVKIFDGK
jgi:hypothetical protein